MVNTIFFFLYLGFLPLTFIFHGAAEERGRIFPTPLYHFGPASGHFGMGQAITAGSSPLRIASDTMRARSPRSPGAVRRPVGYYYTHDVRSATGEPSLSSGWRVLSFRD